MLNVAQADGAQDCAIHDYLCSVLLTYYTSVIHDPPPTPLGGPLPSLRVTPPYHPGRYPVARVPVGMQRSGPHYPVKFAEKFINVLLKLKTTPPL